MNHISESRDVIVINHKNCFSFLNFKFRFKTKFCYIEVQNTTDIQLTYAELCYLFATTNLTNLKPKVVALKRVSKCEMCENVVM